MRGIQDAAAVFFVVSMALATFVIATRPGTPAVTYSLDKTITETVSVPTDPAAVYASLQPYIADQIAAEMRDVGQSLAGVRESVDTVIHELTLIDGRNVAVETQVSDVAARLSNAEAGIDHVKTRVGDAETRIDRAEAEANEVKTQVSNIEILAVGITARVSDVESRSRDIETRTSEVENTVVAVDRRTTTAQGTADAAKAAAERIREVPLSAVAMAWVGGCGVGVALTALVVWAVRRRRKMASPAKAGLG